MPTVDDNLSPEKRNPSIIFPLIKTTGSITGGEKDKGYIYKHVNSDIITTCCCKSTA